MSRIELHHTSSKQSPPSIASSIQSSIRRITSSTASKQSSPSTASSIQSSRQLHHGQHLQHPPANGAHPPQPPAYRVAHSPPPPANRAYPPPPPTYKQHASHHLQHLQQAEPTIQCL